MEDTSCNVESTKTLSTYSLTTQLAQRAISSLLLPAFNGHLDHEATIPKIFPG